MKINNYKIITILVFLTMIYIYPSNAIQEQNLNWSEGNVYTLTPASNMATDGNYTVKTIDFPAPVRGRLSVNDTIIPDNPVNLATTIELYKDILSNPNPISTFTLRPGDEYITNSQDLRITIDSMPGEEDSAWVYESYNPSANIRIQQAAIPNMEINLTYTNTNGETIDTVNPGDTFLVNVNIQNSGEDVAKELSYHIVPDPRLQPTSYNNKLQDTISQLNVNDQFTNQLRFIAPSTLGTTAYNIDVNVTSTDSRDVPHYWNNSMSIPVNGSIDMLSLDKDIDRSTIYLKENVHVIISVRNRGTLMIKNVELKDSIPDNFKYIENNEVLDNLTEIAFKRDSLEGEQTWTIDYFLRPTMPGIYVLPAYNASYTMNGVRLSNTSNEVGFRVYGPIIQLNKSIINQGKNILEIDVSANNIGNGPATVIIDDPLPDNSKLLTGNNHSTIFVNANEEKGINYTISFSGKIKDLPPANASYYLEDYKFTTSSAENVIKAPPPQEAVGNVAVGNIAITVAVPTIQETEKKVVGTISPESVPPVENKSPGFDYISLIIVFLLLFIKVRNNNKK